MGLLENLFKSSKQSRERNAKVEAALEINGVSQREQSRADDAKSNRTQPGKETVAHTAGHVLRDHHVAPLPPDAMALTLGDILDHIPTHFLRPGLHDAQRRFHLRIADIHMPDAPRPTISLARIDAQCPEVIAGNPAELHSAYVPLPAILIDRVHALHHASAPPIAPQPTVSPRTVATTTSEPRKDSSAPKPPPASGAVPSHTEAPDRGEKVEVNLAVVMKRCPPDIVVRALPPLDESTTLSVPLAAIAAQLPSGKVELTSLQFVGALPNNYTDYFHPIDGVKVPLPLQEILEKLPTARGEPEKQERPADTKDVQLPLPVVVLSNAAATEVIPAPAASRTSAPAATAAAPSTAAARARMKIIPTAGKVATPPGKKARVGKKPLKELAQRLAALPGMRGCAIIAQGDEAIAGEFDRGMDLAAVRGLAVQLDGVLRAGEAPVTVAMREVFLPGDLASFACFIGSDVAVIASLRTQTPLPLVRSELANALFSLSKANLSSP